MKALSIRQPWAWLIVHGYKDVENRTWSTKFRGRVQVHAGKFPDPGWFPQLALEVEARGIALPDQPSLGALVGEVDIIDCVSQWDSPWFIGPYGFLLAKPLVYFQPIPYRGRLGFFETGLPCAPLRPT